MRRRINISTLQAATISQNPRDRDWSWGAQRELVPATRLHIVVLAIAMGLQAVVGQMVSHSTIVFTTTLTRLVGGITDAIATRDPTVLKGFSVQITLIAAYLSGAVLAGVLAVHKMSAVVFLPLGGVAVAFAAHCFSRDRPSLPIRN